ncbi:MBL fold metallo-hydrolase [Aeromonas allosaccharophila]
MNTKKLIALNVNVGDAFYLETSDKKILIDGGQSKNGFPTIFQTNTGHQETDIIVCTHADADHVNGLIGFFEAGFTSKEVWLPGSWSYKLKELAQNPSEFILDAISDPHFHNARALTLDETFLPSLYEDMNYEVTEEQQYQKGEMTDDDLYDILKIINQCNII